MQETPLSPRKVYDALEEAKVRLSRSRALRLQAYREVLGSHYHEQTETTRPTNPLRHSTLVLRSILANRQPTFEVTTSLQPLRGEALMYTKQMERKATELNFRRLNKSVVFDALLSPRSVCRTGVRAGNDVLGAVGREHNIGDWYVRRVDYDRHYVDPTAMSFEEMAWEAERVTLPRELVLSSGLFDNEMIEKLPVMERRSGEKGVSSIASLSGLRGHRGEDEIIPTIDVFEVFFYDLTGDGRTVKVVLPCDYSANEFLAVVEHEGPTRGPFHWLEFDVVPDNITAFSPASQQMEQHEAASVVWAKLREQAEASKRKAVYDENVVKDEIDAIEADDQEPVRMRDPKAAQVLDMTMISPQLVAIAERFQTIANTFGRNPEIMAGIQSSAGTATEFSGLMGMIQGRIDEMKDTIGAFWQSIGRDLLWYEVNDPRVNYRFQTTLPSGRNIPLVFSAAAKEGGFADFALCVKPGSTGYIDKTIQSRQLMDLAAQAPVFLQLETMSAGLFAGITMFEDLLAKAGIDDPSRYIRDPNLLREQLQLLQLAGMPEMGTQAPPSGRRAPVQGERKPIDEARSAQSEAVPA